MTQEEESFSGLIEALTKHGEVMVRSFEKNRTLVEQGSQNDCFYRFVLLFFYCFFFFFYYLEIEREEEKVGGENE